MSDRRTIATPVVLLSCLLAFGAVPARANDASAVRIVVATGIHPPHQGFALSSEVPSDEACLAVGQNLAAELGTAVHVMCMAPSGAVTVVANCGFVVEVTSADVGNYHYPGWTQERTKHLVCAKPARDRYPAKRIAPQVDALRR